MPQRDAYRQDLCYLGHLNALQESMTVDENLAFTTALGGFAPDKAQTQALLTRFGLRGRGKQLVRHLSQGQKRRVALSRLALSPARLWVLDEPYVAMDEAGIGLLADLIAGHLASWRAGGADQPPARADRQCAGANAGVAGGMSSATKPVGLGHVLLAVLRREISLGMRQKGEVLTPLVFFVVIASLFPLGVGPESALLLRMAPGVLWVSALLAAMLSLQRMFATDYADGSLEQMALSSTPLALLVLAKALAHFLLSGLPLVLDGTGVGTAIWSGQPGPGHPDAVAAAGHTDLEPDWQHWRRADLGRTRCRGFAVLVNLAAVYSGADFWCGCG